MLVKHSTNALEMSYEASKSCVDELRSLFPELRDDYDGAGRTASGAYLYYMKIKNYRIKKYGESYGSYYFNQDFIKDHLDSENKILRRLLIEEAKSDDIKVYLKLKGSN